MGHGMEGRVLVNISKCIQTYTRGCELFVKTGTCKCPGVCVHTSICDNNIVYIMHAQKWEIKMGERG